jgi:hypothetical protein
MLLAVQDPLQQPEDPYHGQRQDQQPRQADRDPQN